MSKRNYDDPWEQCFMALGSHDEHIDLGAFRGLLVAVIISLPFWLALGALVWAYGGQG